MIFILKRNRSFFLTSLLLSVFSCLFLLFFNTNLTLLSFANSLTICTGVLVAFFIIEKSLLINKNYIAHIIYLSLLIAFIPKELDFEFCFAFLLVHVILFLFLNDESLHYLTYFNIGILLFIVNYLYFQSISFTIALIFYAIIFSKSFWSKLIQITFGFILTLLTLIQVNYLKEFDANFWYFFCDKSINLISLTTQNYYLIPFILILIFSIIDTYQNSNKQSFLKKYENNKFIIILSFGFLSLFLVNDLTFNYLLMLIFPISVYISRLINYQKKKYFQEIIFLILILSLILFKLN